MSSSSPAGVAAQRISRASQYDKTVAGFDVYPQNSDTRRFFGFEKVNLATFPDAVIANPAAFPTANDATSSPSMKNQSGLFALLLGS
jgi:hypothetical protein